DRNLEFDIAAVEDLVGWVEKDRKKALRILRIIQETHRDPFAGIGKPEPLRHELAGCWSRRIDDENRIVYQVQEPKSEFSRVGTITISSVIRSSFFFALVGACTIMPRFQFNGKGKTMKRISIAVFAIWWFVIAAPIRADDFRHPVPKNAGDAASQAY